MKVTLVIKNGILETIDGFFSEEKAIEYIKDKSGVYTLKQIEIKDDLHLIKEYYKYTIRKPTSILNAKFSDIVEVLIDLDITKNYKISQEEVKEILSKLSTNQRKAITQCLDAGINSIKPVKEIYTTNLYIKDEGDFITAFSINSFEEAKEEALKLYENWYDKQFS